jgi:hypothetical protein
VIITISTAMLVATLFAAKLVDLGLSSIKNSGWGCWSAMVIRLIGFIGHMRLCLSSCRFKPGYVRLSKSCLVT